MRNEVDRIESAPEKVGENASGRFDTQTRSALIQLDDTLIDELVYRKDPLYISEQPEIRQWITQRPDSLQELEWNELVSHCVQFLAKHLGKLVRSYLWPFPQRDEEAEDLWCEVYEAVRKTRPKYLSTAYFVKALRRQIGKSANAREQKRSASSVLRHHALENVRLSDAESIQLAPLFKEWRNATVIHFQNTNANWIEHWMPFVLYWLPRLDISAVAYILDEPTNNLFEMEQTIIANSHFASRNQTPRELNLNTAAEDFGNHYYQLVWNSNKSSMEKELVSFRTDQLSDIRNCSSILDACFGASSILSKITNLKQVLQPVTQRWCSK